MKKNSPEDKMKTTGMFFIIIGLPLALFGINDGYKVFELYSSGIKTVGTVVEQKVVQSGSGSPSYKPIFQFQAKDKKTITVTPFVSSSFYKQYTKGAKIPVIYNLTKPQEARINHLLWVFSTFLTLFGLVFAGVGHFFFQKNRSRKDLEQLRFTGIAIQAKYVSFKAGWKVGNEQSFHLICEGLDPRSGQIRQYKSQAIWGRLPNHVLPGAMLRIYIDQKNSDHYYVDLDEKLNVAA